MTKQINYAALPHLLVALALLSLILSGAIFGFFYAWICSTMWGLDAAEPAVAIAAMQAMNASVRNAVFAPAFFGTPVALVVTALLARARQRQVSAWAFSAAAAVYVVGGFLATMAVNVPMNEALAQVAIPESTEAAQELWQDYSGRWQVWNIVRTLASGFSLILTGLAILHLTKVKN